MIHDAHKRVRVFGCMISVSWVWIMSNMSLSLPDAASRLITTTRLSDCRPTATRSPTLLTENWRGMRPPAGNFCSSVRPPVLASMVKVLSESEGICAPSPGVSGLLMLKAESLRDETVKNLPSDCFKSTHRNPNLGGAGTGRRRGTGAVGGAGEHLGEAERLVLAVGDVVRLALGGDEELDVAGSAAGGGDEGVDGREVVGAVNGKNADEVGAQVGNQDELALGVEEDLVRVRGILARRVGAGSRHVERLGLDGREGRRVGDVEPAHRGAAAGKSQLVLVANKHQDILLSDGEALALFAKDNGAHGTVDGLRLGQLLQHTVGGGLEGRDGADIGCKTLIRAKQPRVGLVELEPGRAGRAAVGGGERLQGGLRGVCA
ncbi:extracellular aldonolactonase [Colletotrichum scovillei]|uniref:Extracellular aldonolactonase n=1 Tax=Colletotrichum scovillei TaxID=1209932 RepID=A0A9P7U804_9PEZI|nr:extracellular aldonolactonase [Colletotrichum scovillei]KAG7045842.1 extracellular aldonolactonase [Colletotrichum scovillei]KAG7063186.1 extracellular aldonolactonase [Colletotrichum scovillei]